MEVTLISLLVLITFVLVALAFFRPRPNPLMERLQPYETGSGTSKQSELDKPFFERILRPFFASVARHLARMTPQQMNAKVAAELAQAGNPTSLVTFQSLRALFTIGLPAIYGLPLLTRRQPVSIIELIVLGALLFFGYRLPVTWLHLKVSARKKTIERSLPDALDLITVCMEAGLAFDASLSKLVQKTKGPLSDEFGRVLQEVNLGKLRREAMRDLGIRAGVPDLQSFVAAVVQADQMGIPLADILRVQSDELRVRRRQRAEEESMKAPIKMLFPLIFCIFPAMMIVLLGPAAYSVWTNIMGGMQGR